MSNGESFGRRVRERRRELALTQEELAHRVGCAPITIRKTEHDDIRPSVQIAERLAQALAIPWKSVPPLSAWPAPSPSLSQSLR